MTVKVPSIVLDMPEDIYHSDPVAGGSLSHTGAEAVLKSPALFQHRITHPRESAAFDIGKLAHAEVLGTGAQAIEIPDTVLASNGAASTREARAFIAEARAAGLVPVKADVLDQVRAIRDAVMAHPTARAIFELEGNAEVSVFNRDPATGEVLRARIDYLTKPALPRPVAVDLKTARSADPRQFRRHAAEYGYHSQAAWYCDLLQSIAADHEPIPFLFIVVEVEPPHLVSVIEMIPEAIERGRERNRAAISLWHQCRELGAWPGYGSEIHHIDLPAWAMSEEDVIL